MKKRALVPVLLAVGLPTFAAAQDYTDYSSDTTGDRWYVTPEIGAIVPDHKRGVVDDDYLYGIALGRELGPFFNIEINGTATRLNNNRARFGFFPGHVSIYGAALDLQGILFRGNIIAPYGVVGVGLTRDVYASPLGDRTNFSPELGVGAYINLWNAPDGTAGFALRPEIKARWDNAPGNGPSYVPFGRANSFVDYLFTVGFQFSFGGYPVSHRAAETYEAPPPPAPVVQAPPPPPPPAPAAPSVLPQTGSVTLTGVTFAHDRAELTATSHDVLDEMATGLKEHPGLKVEIQGHTDSTGSAAYNQQLSQRRADAVREYLIEQGVSPTQVVAKGYGETMPVDTNSTAAGRAHNRRVVAKVLENPDAVAVKGEGETETHLATPATPQ